MKIGIRTIEALASVKAGIKNPKGRKPGFYSPELDVRLSDHRVAALRELGLVDGNALSPTGELVLQAFKLGKRYG
jgi:hypothetical protein